MTPHLLPRSIRCGRRPIRDSIGCRERRSLAAFVAVADFGSFTAAAQRGEFTKSALSQAVTMLERELGGQLLQRSTRRMAITEAGQAFLADCRALLAQAEQAVERARTGRASISTSAAVALQGLALAGAGVAAVPEPMVRAELEAGALRRVLPAYRMPQLYFFAVYPGTMAPPAKTRAFIDPVKERAPPAGSPPGTRSSRRRLA